MNEIIKKIQIKDNTYKSLINLDDDMKLVFSILKEDDKSINIIVQGSNKLEVEELLNNVFKEYLLGDNLWVIYPKKTSKKYSTDLDRNYFFDNFTNVGFRPVRLISINDDLSAIRLRKIIEVK